MPFPFTDLSAAKRRPAIVLWADPAQSDFTVAFVSSQQITPIGLGETLVLPTHPEFPLTGLSVPSKVRATKLVTLSACDTGIGEVRTGEGVYGLRRALFIAGTETLVMSLWPVSDYVTREVELLGNPPGVHRHAA